MEASSMNNECNRLCKSYVAKQSTECWPINLKKEKLNFTNEIIIKIPFIINIQGCSLEGFTENYFRLYLFSSKDHFGKSFVQDLILHQS